MTNEYQLLEGKVAAALHDLKKNYPAELNQQSQSKLDSLQRYCSDRIVPEPSLEFSITCKKSGFSLSDVLNYTALVPSKDHELLMIQAGFVREVPEKTKTPKQPRKIHWQIPGKVMKVQEYKTLLMAQLSNLAAAQPDEEIEIDIDIQE